MKRRVVIALFFSTVMVLLSASLFLASSLLGLAVGALILKGAQFSQSAWNATMFISAIAVPAFFSGAILGRVSNVSSTRITAPLGCALPGLILIAWQDGTMSWHLDVMPIPVIIVVSPAVLCYISVRMYHGASRNKTLPEQHTDEPKAQHSRIEDDRAPKEPSDT